ncbi:GH11825 [Drosophila grimshawi]|uniref:GH11825 n=1 Tax=Drosophila grimshawi TaxID=7222 RepID=B4JIQ6_DROGR|nr:GH11825 [Drosophila grimshawi]
MLGGVGARRRRGSSPMARLTNANIFSLDDNIAIIGDGVTRCGAPPNPQAFNKRRRTAAAVASATVSAQMENAAPAQIRLKLGDIM